MTQRLQTDADLERIRATAYPDSAQPDIDLLLDMVDRFRSRKRVQPTTPPIYDEVYFEGLAALDDM